MKTVVIIPARYQSTRFPGKPLAKICGKLMIQWVYENSKKAEKISHVVVATDDDRVGEAVRSFGGDVIMTSDQNRSGTDRVAEAADKMGLSPQDIIVNVQGDQPLIEPRCLDDVVRPFFDEPEISMSTLAFKIVRKEEITSPKHVKVIFDQSGFALYFSRSPIPFGRDRDIHFDTYKHLGVYAYTRQYLDIFRKLPEGHLEQIEKLEQLRALEYGYKIKIVLTDIDSPEVDVVEDIGRVEEIVRGRGALGEGQGIRF
jgi:3-deoxy-manno-octulosonate cytidylyltransferase (CMP-KDO synthetase)